MPSFVVCEIKGGYALICCVCEMFAGSIHETFAFIRRYVVCFWFLVFILFCVIFCVGLFVMVTMQTICCVLLLMPGVIGWWNVLVFISIHPPN